jgi:hypothetical protein
MASYDKPLHEEYRIALQNQSLSNVLPGFVGKYGINRNMNFWGYIRENPNDKAFGVTGGAYGTPKNSWGDMATSALNVLGNRPYAAGPTLLTRTPEEVRQAEAKRSVRKRGRRRTMLTGSLEPQTNKKTLLG